MTVRLPAVLAGARCMHDHLHAAVPLLPLGLVPALLRDNWKLPRHPQTLHLAVNVVVVLGTSLAI